MKINRVSKGKEKFSKKDSIFLNIYYFFCLYQYVFLLLIGVAIAIFIILFVVDKIAHKELAALDAKTTMLLFDELQEHNRHHEAISLMEYKGGIFEGDPLELEYKDKLSDSYIHVGDYSKAEKMLLDVENNAPKYLSKAKNLDEKIVSLLQFCIARNIYQFYEKIGDSKNQINYYEKYRKYYNLCGEDIDSIMTIVYNSKCPFQRKSVTNIKEILKFDSLVVAHAKDSVNGVAELSAFVDKIIDRKEYGPTFKVKCLNRLIKWKLNEGKLMEAYPRIAQAIDQVTLMRDPKEYEDLGELSDYCYEVHDIETSKALFNRYKKYLMKFYRKDDLEYISNYARELRYIEDERDWDKLSAKVINYCEGMRKQIASNIPSMTEEQRDMFVQQFDKVYYYAFHVLQEHPSEKLAILCFDNITFRSGLLLRSNLSLRRSIENMNDPAIMEEYNRLNNLRIELIYYSIRPKILFSNVKKLSNDIDELEKDLALKCVDYKRKNQGVEYSYKDVQRELTSRDAFIDFIETDGNLFALVLRKKGIVDYVPIGENNDIASKLCRSINEIYHDTILTQYLWSKVGNLVKDYSNIYCMPVGLFNQIAIGSMRVDSNHYLCDMKTWKLISNPSALKDMVSSLTLSDKNHTISLWGGIDYGEGTTQKVSKEFHRGAIKRGEMLASLRYALAEVKDISTLLEEKHINNIVYTGDGATKMTFKDRSGKGDYVMHISTHGFFDDEPSMYNPMLHSGLFFADANKYWCNDSTYLPPNQDDGILRAAEIATLDLSGCSLVVLSACETGLGFNSSSEGVYGLQRAFKLAGTDLILMSLWDVDDQATELLMTEFYKHLLTNDDVDDALRKSQKAVRQAYPSPEDWGGFVLLH